MANVLEAYARKAGGFNCRLVSVDDNELRHVISQVFMVRNKRELEAIAKNAEATVRMMED